MRSVDGGVATSADGGSSCSGLLPMRLLETARNDIPGSPSGANKAPAYGLTAGRLLEAAELNSLTKACASFTGDYNDNKLDDITEVQGRRRSQPAHSARGSRAARVVRLLSRAQQRVGGERGAHDPRALALRCRLPLPLRP